jgi:orotidine-5'-phosphate decarboxylase
MNATPSANHFADRLAQAVRQRGNPVCVGLDPRYASLPQGLRSRGDDPSPGQAAGAYRLFCEHIIDVVAPLVPCVKPQAAFFEEQGPAGVQALVDVVHYAQRAGLVVILDAKRGDIGSTAEAYASAYLGERDTAADCLTVNPYLGLDSLEPFVDTAAKHGNGLFVLVKTSNPGGKTFQDLLVDGQPLYRHVGAMVESLSAAHRGTCGYGHVGAVVGATYPGQLVELREAMPSTWFLVPGFGAQGGAAADVAGAFDAHGLGGLINNSRGLIFAHKREPYAQKYGDKEWQRAVEEATKEMIGQLRDGTTAGKL